MDLVTSLTAIIGIGIVIFILFAFLRGEFRNMETPKYEMLNIEKPEITHEKIPGRIGVEDRIIRIGLVGAGFYYAARIGHESEIATVLSAIALYLLITGLFGDDPIYEFFKVDTKIADQ